MKFPDYYGVRKKKVKPNKNKKGNWEVAGFCEDSEYEYDILMNAKRDLEEAGLETKIEKSSYGYILYAR